MTYGIRELSMTTRETDFLAKIVELEFANALREIGVSGSVSSGRYAPTAVSTNSRGSRRYVGVVFDSVVIMGASYPGLGIMATFTDADLIGTSLFQVADSYPSHPHVDYQSHTLGASRNGVMCASDGGLSDISFYMRRGKYKNALTRALGIFASVSMSHRVRLFAYECARCGEFVARSEEGARRCGLCRAYPLCLDCSSVGSRTEYCLDCANLEIVFEEGSMKVPLQEIITPRCDHCGNPVSRTYSNGFECGYCGKIFKSRTCRETTHIYPLHYFGRWGANGRQYVQIIYRKFVGSPLGNFVESSYRLDLRGSRIEEVEET